MVVAEGALLHIVQVVVVPVAHIVEQAQRTAVAVEEAVVSLVGVEVLYLVAHAVGDVARGVFKIGVGILHAIAAGGLLLGEGSCREVARVLSPGGVVEEVLQAVLAHDDAQLRGVATGKDAVAAEDEVLRSEGGLAATRSLVAQVELSQAGASGEGRVGDGEQQRGVAVEAAAAALGKLDALHLGVALEGVAADTHRAVVIDRADVVVDGEVGLVGVGFFDIGMVDELLVGRRYAESHHSHLVDVGYHVVGHAVLHLVLVHLARERLELADHVRAGECC